ncbi:MAG: type II toxin-antitoxin system VapB family antitoxin [Thermus caldifontis]
MALTIRDKEVERLVKEVTRLTGESAAEAVRKALEIRLAEIKPKENLEHLMHVLEKKSGPNCHRSI